MWFFPSHVSEVEKLANGFNPLTSKEKVKYLQITLNKFSIKKNYESWPLCYFRKNKQLHLVLTGGIMTFSPVNWQLKIPTHVAHFCFIFSLNFSCFAFQCLCFAGVSFVSETLTLSSASLVLGFLFTVTFQHKQSIFITSKETSLLLLTN